MKKIAFIPADANNKKYADMCVTSLRKFHSEEELPVKIIDNPTKDNMFWYRATPIIAKDLLKEYELVIKLDADQIITGSLNALWKEPDFDVAVVNNSNPREYESYPYNFLNINPLSYVNNGLVVIKSPEFVDFWYNMCHSILFQGFQMREQDCLNILVHSNNYKIKRLDEDDSFYSLASKGYWQDIILEGDELVLKKGETWPDKDKKIKVIHWAGGSSPDKMNYRIRFTPEVVKRLDFLVK